MVFHVENAIQHVSVAALAVQRAICCRANACGTTMLFCHANGTGATKKSDRNDYYYIE